ncbi:MAG TPA: alpha/beta hydrolase [Gemmataceae bacterium]|nr:alpha/beta hydrolase [Gemmataceae bacterium]
MKTARSGFAAAVLAVLAVGAAWAADKGPAKPADKGLAGSWQGSIKAGAIELRIVLNVTAKEDGALLATLDSPDQGAKGIPVDDVSAKGKDVKVELKALKASFEGKRSDDGKKIAGTWKQGGSDFPLTFERLAKAPDYARPQDPKKPYPYAEEEVTFENKPAGVKFAGTLTLPRGKGPFPAAVLITGSGAHDRNESLLGHRPFLVLADHLTRHGVAVLRYDDRGVGGSTGDKLAVTSADLAGDALAAVAFLEGRPEIDPKKVGLIGHSEGGIIAPMAAAKSGGVAFIVLLAGPGLPGEEILYRQGELIARAGGADDKAVARARTMQEKVFAVVKKEKDDKAAREQIEAAVREEMAKLSDGEKKEAEKRKAFGEAQRGFLVTPWFRFFLTYDPAPTLEKVKCPVLALNGERDLQVPAKPDLKVIEQALKDGGNKDVTTKELPKLNHLFQTCKTGAPSEYGKIDETFAPSALEEISGWITKRFAPP